MRILIVHNAYAQPGGEDAVVRRECEALRARGHELHLAVRESAQLVGAPARAVVETVLAAGNPAAARLLARTVRAVRPDVAHVHNLFPRWGLAALRVLGAHHVPTVQTLHNFRWLCAPATFVRDHRECRLCAAGSFASAVRFACMRDSRAISAAYASALALNRRTQLAQRVVDRFVCVSEHVRTAHLAAGFPTDRLAVKGHFVADAPGADGPGDGSVLFVGRLAAEKGAALLIDALGPRDEVTLDVVGDGPERGALEAAARRARAKVRFHGFRPQAEVRDALRRCSVCVVPSLGAETFGLAALEAFACGRPVVASDAGGLPELVRDGVNGFVVPRGDPHALADRVGWLLAHPEQARAFGEAGRALVQQSYLPSANVARLEQLYREAIGAHTHAAHAEPRRADAQL